MFLAPILSNKLTSFANAKNFDTSSLRLIHCGGSAMNLTQYQNLVDTFPHTKVCGIYGLTEIGVTSVFHPETDKDMIPVKPTSCGKPFYTMKIKVLYQSVKPNGVTAVVDSGRGHGGSSWS
jgi:acyl-coenzyme A synthetase/AMP-(fatty) acid ligase